MSYHVRRMTLGRLACVTDCKLYCQRLCSPAVTYGVGGNAALESSGGRLRRRRLSAKDGSESSGILGSGSGYGGGVRDVGDRSLMGGGDGGWGGRGGGGGGGGGGGSRGELDRGDGDGGNRRMGSAYDGSREVTMTMCCFLSTTAFPFLP